MSNDKRGVYVLVAIALLAVIALSLAYYFTYRDILFMGRNINDGDKGMIIGFQ